MRFRVLHGGYELETLERKAEWYRSLSMLERLEYLSEMYDFVTLLNPSLRRVRENRAPSPSVRVLRLPQG